MAEQVGQAEQVERVFVYGEWSSEEDPGEEFSNEDMRASLAGYFPELANAAIQTKMLDDGREQVTFVKMAGTKGKGAR